MLLRNLSKTVRGKVTPVQILISAILGGMLGFVPGIFLGSEQGGGFSQAPGLILTIAALVLLLNCNLFLFLLCFGVFKLLSLVLMPVSFAIGQFLLDGPTSGLFAAMINAPVLAWFGLEYYATTGGVLLGAILGLVVALLMLRVLKLLRGVLAQGEDKEELQGFLARKPVRFTSWVFFGGKGKKKYSELLEKQKLGLPIRWSGLVAVVLLGAGAWFAQSTLAAGFIRQGIINQLETVNGATVDLAEVEVDLGGGKVRLAGLAMADSSKLDTDLLRADQLDLDLGTRDLLTKRVVVESLVCEEAHSGVPRKTPGRIIPAHKDVKEPEKREGEKTLEDYLADIERWRERLKQWEGYIDGIFGGGSDPSGEGGAGTTPPSAPEIEAKKERYGLAAVAAEHLIQKAPRLLIKRLSLKGIRVGSGGQEILDVSGLNLASDPSLVPEPTALKVTRRDGELDVELSTTPKAGNVDLKFQSGDMSLDRLLSGIKADVPLKGGRIGLRVDGKLDLGNASGVGIDFNVPMRITNSQLRIGDNQYPIDDLSVPLGLRGPLSAPLIKIDSSALVKALHKAGKQELVNQLTKHLGDKLPVDVRKLVEDPAGTAKQLAEEQAAKAKKLVDEEAAKARRLADAKLAEAKKAADELKKKAEAEKKKREDELRKKAAEEVQNRLKKLLGEKKK